MLQNWGMTLDEYLSSDDAMSPADLCRAIGVKNADQLRQWRHGYGGRRPDPANCVAIERATSGKVSRQDLRPDDWQAIWPELIPAKKPAAIKAKRPKVSSRPAEEQAEA